MSKISAAKTEALKSSAKKTDTTTVAPTAPAVAKQTPATKAPVKAVATTTNVTEKITTVKEKTPKQKMERDSFTMPKTEYAQLAVLKDRLTKLGQPAKKSELLRAGIMQLSAMTDAALKGAMSKVPAIKTGRPKKK